MKRTKHHNKRRLPAAMLIQCLWRMEVGRRDGQKELANVLIAQRNGNLPTFNLSEKISNGRLEAAEDRSKRIIGAIYSLRRLKYLACR